MSADLHGSTPPDVESAEKIVTSGPDVTVIFGCHFVGEKEHADVTRQQSKTIYIYYIKQPL